MFWLVFPTLAVVLARKSATIVMGDTYVDGSETTECRQILLPSRSILNDILCVTDTFDSEEEEEMCLNMVKELSTEEQEYAAYTSYAYWAASLLQQSAPDLHTESVRVRFAMREARRHLIAEKRKYERAITRFKNAIAWRKELQIDLLRSCFASIKGSDAPENTREPPTADVQVASIYLTKEQSKKCREWEDLIELDLKKQKMAVRGKDKHNRAIIVKQCREVPWDKEDDEAEEGYRMAQIYIAERAMAATELMTKGSTGKISAVFDFSTYDSTNSPPVKLMIDTVKMLQANYPERLGKALILEAPFWMLAVFKVVSAFLAEETRAKVSIVSSGSLSSLWPFGGSSPETSREAIVRDVVDSSQAMPFMLPDAELNSEISIERQLKDVPFHELYDFDKVILSDDPLEAA